MHTMCCIHQITAGYQGVHRHWIRTAQAPCPEPPPSTPRPAGPSGGMSVSLWVSTWCAMPGAMRNSARDGTELALRRAVRALLAECTQAEKARI